VLLLAVPFGCRGQVSSADPEAKKDDLRPVSCGLDEVREFRCDAFVTTHSALPAPEPYESCPSAMPIADATFPPASGTGRFDAPYTAAIRARSSPGHNCCYSWCGKLEVADPDAALPQGGCDQPLSFRESYCMPELEGGTSGELADSPYDRCAVAVRPPAGAVFSVPKAALLDLERTAQRRGQGTRDCCYGWCSIAPPGSGLERQGLVTGP
jgi:hypothetical protein